MKTTNSSSSSCKEDLLRIVTETYKSVIKKYKDIFNKKGYLPTKRIPLLASMVLRKEILLLIFAIVI